MRYPGNGSPDGKRLGIALWVVKNHSWPYYSVFKQERELWDRTTFRLSPSPAYPAAAHTWFWSCAAFSQFPHNPTLVLPTRGRGSRLSHSIPFVTFGSDYDNSQLQVAHFASANVAAVFLQMGKLRFRGVKRLSLGPPVSHWSPKCKIKHHSLGLLLDLACQYIPLKSIHENRAEHLNMEMYFSCWEKVRWEGDLCLGTAVDHSRTCMLSAFV